MTSKPELNSRHIGLFAVEQSIYSYLRAFAHVIPLLSSFIFFQMLFSETYSTYQI